MLLSPLLITPTATRPERLRVHVDDTGAALSVEQRVVADADVVAVRYVLRDLLRQGELVADVAMTPAGDVGERVWTAPLPEVQILRATAYGLTVEVVTAAGVVTLPQTGAGYVEVVLARQGIAMPDRLGEITDAAEIVREMHAEIAGHFDDMLYLLGQTDYTATLTVGADVLASESVTPEGYPAVTLTLP